MVFKTLDIGQQRTTIPERQETVRRALPVSRIIAARRFSGCVRAGGTRAKLGGLPVLRKWTRGSEKANVVREFTE